MTDSSSSPDALETLFRAGQFDQLDRELQRRLSADPGDERALTFRRHLEHLDLLKQIHQARAVQDWDQLVARLQAALQAGLVWDLDMAPLSDQLTLARHRRTQAADRQAQQLVRQAEASQDPLQARQLYRQALDMPNLSVPLRAQIQRRLDELRTLAPATLSTAITFQQIDALTEQLLDIILTKSRPQLSEAVRLSAIPFWFDQELLTALRASDDGLEPKILARMANLSFVHQDERGRYTLSQEVRHHLLEAWYDDRAGFKAAHQRAQEHFAQRLRDLCRDDERLAALTDLEASQESLNQALVALSPEISELVQNHLYHTLVVDGDVGVAWLRRLFHAATEAHRLALAERLLDLANEQRPWLTPDQRAHIDYLTALLDQAHERWQTSRQRLERMLSREGLPDDLQARVRRAMGNALVRQEQWVQAIALLHQALQTFQAADDQLESALTMLDLGYAHLDLALNTWGGGQIFTPRRRRLDFLGDLFSLVSRLPIILYLMGHLGVSTLLPVILHIGRDMDWIIARLLVVAAGWLGRAERLLTPLGDQEGLGRVEELAAWLYLILGHHRRAADIYRRLVAREETGLGEYRAARARMGLAETLIRRRDPAQARQLLEQALPVFNAYQHTERIAQTHTFLAQTYVLDRQPAQALPHYLQAARLYQQLGDDANTTEIVEQMRALRTAPETDAETRQTIETTTAQVTRRRYLTRFQLPLLYLFRLLALVSLAGLFFFSLYSSIQIEAGTDFGVGQALIGSRQGLTSALEPEIGLDVATSLQPSFEVSFTLYLVLLFTALYLVLYTLLGLWLTVRTPLRALQEGQRLDILVDESGVSCGLKIPWDQVRALLLSDRSLYRTPIQMFSRFALFSPKGLITVDGRTRHYHAARDFICQHLQAADVPRHDFGFSIIRSHSGRLFLGTLLFIVAFVIVAQVAPSILITPLRPLPYSLADLYSVSYLGLLFPLGWWLAVQPMRERIFFKPHTRRVWLVGLAGLLLSAFTVADLLWLKLPLGRPNIAPGLFAAFLTNLSAYYVWTARRWAQVGLRKGAPVYSLGARLVTLFVGLAVLALDLGLVGREAIAYHYLALGGLNQQQAIEAQDPDQAQAYYAQALAAYDRALRWVHDDADVYHSQGATLVQLGRYQEAVNAIQHAISLRPGRITYYNSLGLTHEIWAKALQDDNRNTLALYHFELARDAYTYVIEHSRRSARHLIPTYLARAGAEFQIATYYHKVADQPDAALEHYVAARTDYAWVTQRQPDNAAALSGRGWVGYQLAKLEPDPATRRAALTQALSLFERAAERDPEQISAWTGQGWTHFAIGETYSWYDSESGRRRSACVDSPRNPRTPQEARIYYQENRQAIAAFDHAATLAQDDPSLYSVQGYIYYNLATCPDADAQETYLMAIASFTHALDLQPDNTEWRLRRGNLYYVLTRDFGYDYYRQIIADYEILVAQQPDANWLWFLGSMYRQAGDLDQAVENYAASLELAPANYNHQVLLGWWAYQAGDYDRSVEASQAAIALDPSDPRPYFNWGLARVAQGQPDDAWEAYTQGSAAADQMTDIETALSRYDEGIGDLGAALADPADVAAAFQVRLTFRKGHLQLKTGAEQAALRTYEQGLDMAQKVENLKWLRAAFDEAIADLEMTRTSHLAVELYERLREAAP